MHLQSIILQSWSSLNESDPLDSQEKIDIQEDDNDLFEHFRFDVDKGQSLLRVDKFLMARIMNASRNKIQAAANAGYILVNNVPVKPSYKVKPDDVVAVMMTQPIRDIELIPENIRLDILFEDKDLIVINKPAGMVVHPAYGNYKGTVVNALLGHFKNNHTSNEPNTIGPLLVHRIDKDTSGVMLVAKSEEAQTRLSKQFFHHTIKRKYQAIVWGDVKEDSGTITGHIGRSAKNRKVFTVFPQGEHGKHAVTHFKVIERLGYVTLIECELETGRTHQIRVHLKHIGHALFNDETYGGNEILKGTTFTKYKQFVSNCFKTCPRQALHAKSLGFIHPMNGEPVYFESELPQDMTQLIVKWRHYAIHKLMDDNVAD